MDWDEVLKEATAAAENVLEENWTNVSSAASHSIDMLVQTAAYIAANPDLPAPQQTMLVNNQKLAMQNTLLGFEDVGIVVAEQAVAAAWGVIGAALQTAIGRAIP